MKYIFTCLALGLFLNNISVLAAPVITSFSPAWGTFHTAITINGSGLSNINPDNYGHVVLFGGKTADSIIIVSDNQLIALVGAGNSGSITVVDNNGNVGTMAGFTYIPPALPYNYQWQQFGTLDPNNKVVSICGAWNRHDAKPIVAYQDLATKYAYAAEFSKSANQMTVLGGPISSENCNNIQIVEDANTVDYP